MAVGPKFVAEFAEMKSTVLALTSFVCLVSGLLAVAPTYAAGKELAWHLAWPWWFLSAVAAALLVARYIAAKVSDRRLAAQLRSLHDLDKAVIGYAVFWDSPWVLVPAVPRQLVRLWESGLIVLEPVSESPCPGARVMSVPPRVWKVVAGDTSWARLGLGIRKSLPWVDQLSASSDCFAREMVHQARKWGFTTLDVQPLDDALSREMDTVPKRIQRMEGATDDEAE